jgi:carboxylate-amine ligase
MSAEAVEQIWSAFSVYGIELEYMIVDRRSLSVRPIADQLMEKNGSAGDGEIKCGQLSWSNELVTHVIELKNPRPTASLQSLANALQEQIQAMNQMLAPLGACLMPAAMHPWMNPKTETRLWPQRQSEIYRAYDRIFDCRAHGWANLQSVHINLPFAGDEQFARLHAAIRLVLPILPALAASSPVADGADTGHMDYRMEVYRHNASAIPSLTGQVIPATLSSRAEYEARMLQPMYRGIAPFDPDGILRHEWLNSHGAIARFDRNAIEIRVVDVQECPRADVAIAAATIDLVQMLYQQRLAPLDEQQAMPTERLANIMLACIRDGERAVVADADYLALLGYSAQACAAAQLWEHLLRFMVDAATAHCKIWQEPLFAILKHGPLARRIVTAIGGDFSRLRLQRVYQALCECLDAGSMFACSR